MRKLSSLLCTLALIAGGPAAAAGINIEGLARTCNNCHGINGGSSNNGAAKARQLSPAAVSDAFNSDATGDDNTYWERRRKNNKAAKRSRDARRAKEQEIALRAQFLEQENISMKLEIAHLKAENAQLRRQFQHHLKL